MKETLEEAAENHLQNWRLLNNIHLSNILHAERCKNDFIAGAKWQQQFNDTSEVTRVEVIQHSEPYNGRAYTNYNAKEVEIQFQDRGKTLKIFLK